MPHNTRIRNIEPISNSVTSVFPLSLSLLFLYKVNWLLVMQSINVKRRDKFNTEEKTIVKDAHVTDSFEQPQ
jgi:hypothetical protein